ncbi:MAG: uroporphyrinogen-III C-methyltransferase [Chryseolinea sp.]
MKPKKQVVILGAGPGDPELITLKGMRALSQADVILYDALINTDILKYARSVCKLVAVGKRKGFANHTQDEINQLIVFYAIKGKYVVRLKGGDPFVFGRGHEELEYIVRRGIVAEVIPGISSALAAPSAAGISVTIRGVNESFWVVTGTTSSGDISSDLALAAQSTATIIILMGYTQLTATAALISEYRSSLEPMAIIQNATCPDQKVIFATAGTIVEEATKHQIGTPAVIIAGKVIEERNIFQDVLNNIQETITVSR